MPLRSNLWSDRKRAAIKIRARILNAVRSWFDRHDFIEVHGPIMIPRIGSWPNYFEVKYFDRKAYLTQGLHPYDRVMMANLGRVYTIAPSFRAEQRSTRRHLAEFSQIEADVPYCDLDSLTKIQEMLVSYVCRVLSKEAGQEFAYLQRSIRELRRVHAPFRRLTYDEAVKILQKDGFDIQWGAILEWEHEMHLSLRFGEPYFISEFPIGPETFTYQSHPQKPGLTMSVDLIAPEGYGEISSGGEPTVEKVEMLRKIQEEKITPDERKWYMNLTETDSIPYSVFGMGVERLTQWICKLEHIREASAFPRLVNSIYP